jgi:dTDP-4-amino-4,6-dideoxygalactose transaminase
MNKKCYLKGVITMENTKQWEFAKKLRKFGEPELKYLKQVLDKGAMSIFEVENGMVERFEKAFAKYTNAAMAQGKANAMLGLAEAVSVSGAGVGTEVICDPVVHFGALTSMYFNAVPRFADINPDTYNMDPASLEANITEHTKVVIVTHLWGQMAEMDKIRDICKKHNLFLIEDCAHTVGAYWKGKHAGTYGDLGVFSFQEYKQLSTGDGGMTISNNEELMRNMADVWAFSGESPKFMTLNYRMNAVTAAIGLAQLEKVDDIVGYYNQTLAILNDAIKGCKWLKPRLAPSDAKVAGYWFACTWEGDKYGLDYNKFKKLNKSMNIGLRFGFNEYAPYEFDFFREASAYGHPDCPIRCPVYTSRSDYRYKRGLCPNVENIMPRLVTVRLIFLSIEEAKETAEKLHEAIRIMEQ